MSGLMTEYRKRHGLKSICPINEGVLFFNKNNAPAIIALTSSYTKSVLTCAFCPMNAESITLEIFCHSDDRHDLKQRVVHTHIPPDGDLIEYVINHMPSQNYQPYVSLGERDQERWLWEFYQNTSRMKAITQGGKKSQKTKQAFSHTNWLEQAISFSINYPSEFKLFYDLIYQPCLIARRYILVE